MVFNPITKVIEVGKADQIRAMINSEINVNPNLANRSYVDIYEEILRYISVPADSNTPINQLEKIAIADGSYDHAYTQTWLFIKQAVDINSPNGQTASKAIREYTFKTYETFFGEEYGGKTTEADGIAWMQEISNAIADAVVKGMFTSDKDIKDNPSVKLPSSLDGTNGQLSLLKDIIEADAVTAATEYYADEFGVWAGNAFFVAAGDSRAFNSHLLHDGNHDDNFNHNTDDTYDLLAASKAILELGGELSFLDSIKLFGTNVWQANSLSHLIAAASNADTFLENAYDKSGGIEFSQIRPWNLNLGTIETDLIYDEDNEVLDLINVINLAPTLVNAFFNFVAGTGQMTIINAGRGDDTIIITSGNDIIDGGDGTDTVVYSGTYNTKINLEEGYAIIDDFLGETIDQLYRIENAKGSYGNDTITGNTENNEIIGHAGTDTFEMNGDFGDDIIFDNGGVLLIDGQTPILNADGNLLQVGSGADKREFKFGLVEEVTTSLSADPIPGDHLLLKEWDSNTRTELPNTIAVLDYFTFKADWNFSVSDANIIEGDNNYNYLIGTSSHDHIIAKAGFLDVLAGLGGHDRLVGGNGADIMDGGEGFDTYVYHSISDSFKTPTSDDTYDSIVTFVQGEDKIDVTGLGFADIKAVGTGASNDLEFEHITTSTGALKTAVSSNFTNFYLEINGHINLLDLDFIGLADESLTLVGTHDSNDYTDSAFDDNITTLGGNDTAHLNGGNDIFNAGEGSADKAVYAATSANYTLSTLTAQDITVTDDVGSDGVDSLTNVEILEFSNMTLYWNGTTWNGTEPDHAPNAGNESVITDFEHAVTVDVLFNDSDIEDESFNSGSLSIDTNPANGVVAINNNGTITYTPNNSFSGSDSFIYTLTDSAGGTDTASVYIAVGAAPANVDPVAGDDTVTVGYETATTIAVLSNDTDDSTLDGSHITIDADPANGTLIVNADGTITYTPDAAYDGVDSFDYTITDPSGSSDTATVSITVSPEPSNYAPFAENDTAVVDRDSSVDIAVLGNDTDTEDTTFTNSNLSIDTNPVNGSVSVNSNGTIAYTPTTGYVGVDSFTYTLTDSGGETDTATVNVTVQAAVDPNATATHTGDANNNNITSGSANDTLLGLDGNDTLYGVAGDDQLVGGLGDDTLKGYSGNDTYIWASGDGNDRVQESYVSGSGTDTLHFAGGITLSDLNIYGYTGRDLKVEHVPTGETITIQYQYSNYTHYRVESLSFDDGSSFNLLQGMTWQGDTASQRLDAGIYDDSLRGGQGNDTVLGNAGNDTLYGDLGNDSVYGGYDDDTYVWRSGDGDDLLIESNSGGTDTLLLTGGITLSDVNVYGYTSHDMRVEYIPTGEIITLQNVHYSDADYRIETLTFDDGSSYNFDQAALWLGGVDNQSLKGSIYNDTMRGGKDNDTINGDAGDDTLYGDLGDDTVYGSTGDDTYVWEAGRGNDLFIEQNYTGSGTDTVYLKGGITFSDLHIYGYTSHDLRIEHTPTGEIITLQNLHYSDTDYHIEFLSFDDGTTYDLQTGVQWLGGVGNQHLQGSIYDDSMFGGKDNDTLSGDAGDDTLSGDLGNDSLKGATGNDTYLWKAGDGNDIFAEQSNSGSTGDIIFLTGGITLADLDIYGTTSHDVKVVYTPTGETFTIQNHLHSDVDYHIETLQFDNGTTYNLEQGVEVRGGTSGDNLDGGAYNDTMLGGGGNDTLEGLGGDDVFEGGVGADRLYGGVGDDTYVWESGDGNDLIYEQNYTGSGSDTLHLIGGIVAADVTFSQTGNDLLVTYTPTGESIRIDNQYVSDTDYHVETLLFDNGSTVDLLGV
ncbi:hemolysin type calcium-binding protein [Aquimarina sp. MAR_2010_214]|uniref:Ig-like domain-containing protein n=1 Tax=Aquimarina sp. MAR_2010_214 TaxID=1250026 RepID=UPI000C70DC41|nr:Ig-like domain-containing protein [Aquimarina sp. MAR_2010_214]PKV50844.1 hemolysin type calcium-binding protein [Aquimarina sp. MAR_2010_214]